MDNSGNVTETSDEEYMLVLTILEKIKEARVKFSQGCVIYL